MENYMVLGVEREFGEVLFYFQDSVTTIMDGIIDLHNDIFYFLIIIVLFVLWMVFYVVNVYRVDRGVINKERLITNKVVHGTMIEIIWTILPSLVLIMIALPSFSLLYSMDEVVYPDLTVKVIGHQWYWSYDLAVVMNQIAADGTNFEQYSEVEFDSYMLDVNDLKLGELRLLEVDNPLYLPIQVHVRFLITSTDVLHCWAVPALGVKVDAIPGRINQTSAFMKREGIFYGQCSEICGVNHGFMPITIKAFIMPKITTEEQINNLDDSSNLLNVTC